VNWAIEFGGDPQDVTVTTAGKASRDGFFGFNLDLVSDARWRPGMLVLLDHSALDTSELTGHDVEEIAAFVRRLSAQFGSCCCAVLTPDPYARGLADVSISYVTPSTLDVRTFATRAEVLEWLRDRKLGRST
jgi:hypothetical protein